MTHEEIMTYGEEEGRGYDELSDLRAQIAVLQNELFYDRHSQIQRLHLSEGDILLVKLGGDLNDGLPPWIPNSDDIDYTAKTFKAAVPDGVKVLVHHQLVDVSVTDKLDASNEVVVKAVDGD